MVKNKDLLWTLQTQGFMDTKLYVQEFDKSLTRSITAQELQKQGKEYHDDAIDDVISDDTFQETYVIPQVQKILSSHMLADIPTLLETYGITIEADQDHIELSNDIQKEKHDMV